VAKADDNDRPSRADAVRAAVDQAFSATRGALDELRPAGGEELRRLADRVDALEARVAALEPAARARKPAARARKPKP
jgi:signal transduction histidine kinase